jgi:hypothetical protein
MRGHRGPHALEVPSERQPQWRPFWSLILILSAPAFLFSIQIGLTARRRRPGMARHL